MVSLRKVFVKIKILFRIRIRIRIMILLWISITDLDFTHKDTHQILFGSANYLESYRVYMKRPRTYSQTDIQTDRQTEIFLCLFCLVRHTKHEYSSKGENFFFDSCDYNTFSFYILRMWWESKKGCESGFPYCFLTDFTKFFL